MERKLTKDELILLVDKVLRAEGTESEIDAMLLIIEKNVPHPEVSDLIFWNDNDLSASEIVEKALSYKPLIVS